MGASGVGHVQPVYCLIRLLLFLQRTCRSSSSRELLPINLILIAYTYAKNSHPCFVDSEEGVERDYNFA